MLILPSPDPDRDTRITPLRAHVAETYAYDPDSLAARPAATAPSEGAAAKPTPPAIATLGLENRLEKLFTRMLRQRAADAPTRYWNYFELRGMMFGIVYRAALAPRNYDEREVAAALEAWPLWWVLMHAQAAAETVHQAQGDPRGRRDRLSA